MAPAVVCDAKSEIARARRLALGRDILLIVVLLAVDFLFIRWPATHVPLLDRVESLTLMRALNLLVFAQIWVARALPRWRARRIASTWCPSERKRFIAAERKLRAPF